MKPVHRRVERRPHAAKRLVILHDPRPAGRAVSPLVRALDCSPRINAQPDGTIRAEVIIGAEVPAKRLYLAVSLRARAGKGRARNPAEPCTGCRSVNAELSASRDRTEEKKNEGNAKGSPATKHELYSTCQNCRKPFGCPIHRALFARSVGSNDLRSSRQKSTSASASAPAPRSPS